jgi:hypothetical protein
MKMNFDFGQHVANGTPAITLLSVGAAGKLIL